MLLTDPTTGGVSASFAMVGDVHIAEPGCMIGFAGKRVIQETIREELPSGFQTAEYLMDHGMIDMVVPRKELRAAIGRVLSLIMKPGFDSGTLTKGGRGRTNAVGNQRSRNDNRSSGDGIRNVARLSSAKKKTVPANINQPEEVKKTAIQ